MIKKIVYRISFAALLALFIMGGLTSPWQQTSTQDSAAEPTPVVLKDVQLLDQGVQVEWLESQPGPHELSGYVIEKSRGGDGDFSSIARAESISLRYLDADGQAGDAYRVIAEDTNQQRSAASEPMVAAARRRGSAIVVSPVPQATLGISTPPDQTNTPDAKATTAQNLLKDAFVSFDTAATTHKISAAKSLLTSMQGYQRQILSVWSTLSPAQKASLAQTCKEHMGVFETNLFLLTEDEQLDGLLVVAGCEAMEDGEQ